MSYKFLAEFTVLEETGYSCSLFDMRSVKPGSTSVHFVTPGEGGADMSREP